ncbi:MAG: hypothetical protein JSV19_00510 [Phycisphaerales bacterium]|nr:MAG: hypothetical protein JSV19_00510 [Phycisphaerales bacterium]
MSWIWPTYIHRDLPLTGQQRKAIHRDAWKLWWANRRNITLYLTLPALYLLTVFFVSDMAGRLATIISAGGFTHKLFRAAAPFALFVICFVVGGAVLQRSRFAPCVYQATRRHGYDVCAKCGYWLKGLCEDSRRCPECGMQREAMPPPGAP